MLPVRIPLKVPAWLAICLAVSFAALSVHPAAAQTGPQLLPYTAKLIAGGGPAATYKAGNLCPVSGFTGTDAYGDGCLASEIVLVSARYAVADSTGNVFFSDYTNGLVRRVDAITGVITVVAGGASASPANGVTCGSYASKDALGDGCLGTAVKLSHPTGLAFDGSGNLYFADYGNDTVRKIAATSGAITTSGVISLVAGNVSGTYGYNVNNTAAGGSVSAATQSYLNFPFGIAFDTNGNLYIADEGNNAVEVVNLTAATETIQGLSVPAGTIAKVVGYGSLTGTLAKSPRSGDCPSFSSTSARGGCYFAATFTGTTGVTANIDSVYSIALDGTNNLFFSNEYVNNVGVVTPSNSIYNFAGQPSANTAANVTTRAAAGSFPIGGSFGVAADASSNVYISDAFNGVIWRVDGPLNVNGSQSMYVVAGGVGSTGGPTAVCSAATDTYGDGCPALQAKIGSSNSKGFATTTAPGPGVWGVSVDAYSNLYFGDTETALIREIATGAQFGVIGANQPTDTLDIHFATGDTPATTGAYQLTSGASNFSIGSATCTTNSDKTTDCLLSVTATPTVLGAFSGTLQVTSAFGRVSSFVLGGTYAQSPNTRTAVSYSVATPVCSGTTTYSTSTQVTVTAIVTANGPNPPVGSADNITFYANNGTTNTAIGTVPVSNLGSTANPSYGATLNYTFATVGTYTITAVYSGDSYFKPSTGTSPATFTSATPAIGTTAVTYMQSSVAQGQTALYSFNVNQVVYTGTISFAVTGLPANSSYSLSPTSLTGAGCSGTSTVALSIFTNPKPPSNAAAIGLGGRGRGSWLAILMGAGLALLLGLQRRKTGRAAKVLMAFALLAATSAVTACNSTTVTAATPTPAGNYTITVTATGSAGGTSAVTFPLTVHN